MNSITALLYGAIKSEFEAIQQYKDMASIAISQDKTEIASILEEIASDEMAHVGNLTKLLETFEPNQYSEYLTRFQEGVEETSKDLKEVEQDTKDIKDDNMKPYIDLVLEQAPKAQISKSSFESKDATVIHNNSVENSYHIYTKLKDMASSRNDNIHVSYNKNFIILCNCN